MFPAQYENGIVDDTNGHVTLRWVGNEKKSWKNYGFAGNTLHIWFLLTLTHETIATFIDKTALQ